MSQARQAAMTAAEFLAWEARQDVRWEFDGIRPVAMSGGSIAHARIQHNLVLALGGRLRGTGCNTYGPTTKVSIGPKIRYPDFFVACSPDRLRDQMVADPVVIFEILSDSTARADRNTKLREYVSLASVQRYVLVEQDEASVTIYGRMDTGWRMEALTQDGTIAMPEIGVELPVAEIYEGMAFPPPGDEDAS